jgi:hypothetical protein
LAESQPDIGTELRRIETEVESGNKDLKALGFWRIVARVKRDPALIDRWADDVARIDAKAFDASVRPRFPIWLGNLALLAGLLLGAFAIVVSIHASRATVAGIALLVAAGAWSVCVHSPAHWVTGLAVGIRFRCYFLGGPPPPRPGIKVDYASYLRTDPRRRAWMHASGAVATKAAPFVALSFYPSSNAPAWAGWLVLAFGVLQIVTDVLFSTKSSDWKKVKRELVASRSLVGAPR